MSTIEVIEPLSGKSIVIPVDSAVKIAVDGCEGQQIWVYQQIEGEAKEFLYAKDIASEYSEFVLETPGPDALVATTDDGRITGDRFIVEIADMQMDPGPPTEIGVVQIEFFLVPGVPRSYTLHVPMGTIATQEMTASDVKGLSIQAEGCCPKTTTVTGGGTDDAATGASLTATGECCPCSTNRTEGSGSESNSGANGSPDTSTPLVNVASRGLPLIFTTVHRANERIHTPWGYNRSIGVYRKLLEQGGSFFDHVSIFQQDASREVYEKSGDDYISASGHYGSLVKTASGWFEKTKEGIYYEYNAHGNLKRVLDPNRNEHYYIYNNNTSSQMLLEIKAEKGLRPYFYYDANALCERIALRDPSDSAKNKYLYFQYDGATSYMTKATGPEGCQWYFDYDGSGFITRVIDPDNYSTYFSYAGG